LGVAGKQSLVKNKLEDGIAAFKKLLQLIMVNVVSSQAELADVSFLTDLCFNA